MVRGQRASEPRRAVSGCGFRSAVRLNLLRSAVLAGVEGVQPVGLLVLLGVLLRLLWRLLEGGPAEQRQPRPGKR